MSESSWVTIGSVKRASEIAEHARSETSERVLAVVRINKINPPADVLVVTETRLLTGSSPGWGRKVTTWAVRLSGREIVSLSTHRNRLVAETHAGEVRLGDIFDARERELAVVFVRELQERAGSATREADEPAVLEEGVVEDGLAEALESFVVDEDWPPAAVPQLRSIAVHLKYALKHAATGDVVAEERDLWDARKRADRAGMGARKVRKRIDAEIAAREASGQLRVGSSVLGEVKSKDLILGSKLIVRSDRVLFVGSGRMTCHVLDGDVQAAVEIDGQVFESSRPTLTRMALGAPLPGSALLFGMATQKKSRKDERTASFLLVHPKWQITVKIEPNSAGRERPLAAQINALAASLGRARALPEAARASAPQKAPQTVRAELEEIERMRADGLISDEEAQALRSRTLG